MDGIDIEEFSRLLEDAGFAGALTLVQETLIPLAQAQHISLSKAAWEYADQDEEQDTSWYQLFHALQRIPASSINSLNIHRPL